MKIARLMPVILTCILLSACAGKGLIKEIPVAEFKRFEYHRGGNVTSTHIIAENSKINKDNIEIEKVSIQSDNPYVNFDIVLEGYKRKIEEHLNE